MNVGAEITVGLNEETEKTLSSRLTKQKIARNSPTQVVVTCCEARDITDSQKKYGHDAI